MNDVIQAGARQIDLSVPVCMGVLNVTPDSFSDGSELAVRADSRFRVDIDKALRRAETMVDEGAIFIDVGGESTRPGAAVVSLEEERDRVLPVVEAIAKRLDVCISVDTSSPHLMRDAIAAGAGLINDVRALGRDGALEVISDSDVAVCLMHMQGQPQTMQQTYSYTDLLQELRGFLQQRAEQCLQAGIAADRIMLDPGFGFGKSLQHNYQLLKALPEFAALGFPLLIGLSRKSMIGGVTGRPVEQRLAGSVAATTLGLMGGARVIRSHDVAATVDAIRVHCAYAEA